MADRLMRAISTLLMALLSVAATAEELADPTRPPASLTAPVAAPASGVPEIRPARLQSIIISKTRRTAIIDGESVELGGKYGDAKLIEVNEGSIVLRGAQGLQVLIFNMIKRKLAAILARQLLYIST